METGCIYTEGVVARIGLESATRREVVERLPLHAEQVQRPAPPPHSKDEVSGKELGGVRCSPSASRPCITHRSETSTFFRLQLEEGWASKKRPTTDNALWLKPRWADIKP